MANLGQPHIGLPFVCLANRYDGLNKGFERWPSRGVKVPTMLHQHVDLARTVSGAGQPIVFLQQLDQHHHCHLTVHVTHHLSELHWRALTMVTVGQDLIERHAKGPYV